MDEGKYWYVAILFVIVSVIVMAIFVIGLLVVNRPPSPPLNVHVARQADNVVLSWDPSLSTDVIGYNVYRSERFGDMGKLVATVNETKYIDHPTADATYYYTVMSYDGQYESLSNEQVPYYYDLKGPDIKEVKLNTGNSATTNKNKIIFYIVADSDAVECQIINYTGWFAYYGMYTLTTNLTKGDNLFMFRCKDKWGNIGSITHFVLTYDITPPNITRLSPSDDYVNKNVNLRFSVSEPSMCRLYFGNDVVWSGNVTAEVSINRTLNNSVSYVFSCEDLAGNIATNTGKLIIKKTGTVSLVINNGNDTTYDKNVNVTITFNPFIQNISCEVYNIKFSGTTILKDGAPYTFTPASDNITLNWQLTNSFGKKYVFVMCTLNGQVIGTSFDSIYYKSVSEESPAHEHEEEHHEEYSGPPYDLSIKINNGAECTNDKYVTLSLHARYADECTYKTDYKPWQSWQPYTTSATVRLPVEVGSSGGVFTVSYKCRNDHGESDVASDGIVYDDIPPGSPGDFNVIIYPGYVYLGWSSVSDADKYYIYRMSVRSSKSSDGGHGGAPYFAKVGETTNTFYSDHPSEGVYQYYITAVDCADNEGEHSVIKEVYVDRTPPTVEVTNPSDGATVHSSPVTLSVYADDNHADRLVCNIKDNGHAVWSGGIVSGKERDIPIDLYYGVNHIRVYCSDGVNQGFDMVTLTLEEFTPSPSEREEPSPIS